MDTMSLRLVFVIVRVTDCPIYRITFVDFWSLISYQNSRMLLATTWLGRVPVVSGASATPERSTTSGTFDACGVAITHFESPCGISETLCGTFETPFGAFDALLVDLKCSVGLHL